jgi:restriction endonuclease S subunit
MQYTHYMHTNLKQIADISSGYTFRGSIKNTSEGDVSVLQAKNVVSGKDVSDLKDLVKISSTSLRNPFFLRHNDVLLVSRGSGLGSFRTTVFNSDEKKVMPSSSLHTIRINDVTVLPKYVSLYLNSDSGQKALMQIVTGGSYIRSILVKNLQNLKIPIPSIHTQKSLIAIYENMSKQESLISRKQEIKKNIINATFTKLIK